MCVCGVLSLANGQASIQLLVLSSVLQDMEKIEGKQDDLFIQVVTVQ